MSRSGEGSGRPAVKADSFWIKQFVRSVALVTIGLLGLVAAPQSAAAHGDDETKEGYLLVQQALGYLAEDSGPSGMDLAGEKVDDALETEDQEGVVVAEVEKAKEALAAGRAAQARDLLQHSITEAMQALPPAVGNETGTTRVDPTLPGRQDLQGLDWALLVVAVAVVAVGLVLAIRFRPPESLRQLRRQLGTPSTVTADRAPPAADPGRND